MGLLFKRILFLLVVFCLPIELYAAQMDESQIQQAAHNWLTRNKIFKLEADKGTTYHVEAIYAIAVDQQGNPLAFHVNLSPKGYLIISGNDLISPVIAFSATNDLNFIDHPDNAFRTLLLGDMDQCRRALAETASQAAALGNLQKKSVFNNQLLWQKLLAPENSIEGLTAKSVGDSPLIAPLMTTTWNQNRHYNQLCPPDSQAHEYYYGRMPVGCVATAGGQMMKYYNWPTRGTGSHSYLDDIEGVDTELAANFSDPFNWSAMLDSYNPWGEEPQEAVDAVSELLYELAVSIEMDFNNSGSSASIVDLNSSLASHFYYEAGDILYRSDNDAVFDTAVRNNILAQQVVVATYTGHAVVVDGLDEEGSDDFYHMNYGWGGTNNGWYKLTSVLIDASGTGTRPLFSGIFNIQPKFLPLMKDFTDEIDTDGEIDIIWNFPYARQTEVTQFQILQGQYEAMDYVDTCDDLSDWAGSSYWQMTLDQGYSGGGFYLPPDILGNFDLTLTIPVRADVGTTLSFWYKAVLYDAHLLLQTSADNGETWVTRFDVTGTPWNSGWLEAQVDLADQSQDLLIRFRSAYDRGSYWPSPNGGIWLDDIAIIGAELMDWEVAADSLPPGTDQYRLSLENGSYYFSVQAADSQGWGARSPITGITVQISGTYGDFNRDNDVDGADLVEFILNGTPEKLPEFASRFGYQD